MKRRAALLMLFAGVAATAKPLGMQSSRSGSPPPPPPSGETDDVPLPAGSASMTVRWATESNVDGYMVLIDTTNKTTLQSYTYQYKVTGQSSTSRVFSSIAANTYYIRVCGYVGTRVLEKSFNTTKVAS